MTAKLMGQEDSQGVLLDTCEHLRLKAELHFTTENASVMHVGSDHGYDSYVITGLVESNRPFDVWVVYMEDADNVRYTLTQLPDDGSEPLLRVVEYERGYG